MGIPINNTGPVHLVIDGRPEHLKSSRVEAWVTLPDLLHERAGLTGSKKGYGHGQNGACIVGGRRINSCLTLAVIQDGKEITTLEGLADGS